MSGLEIAATSGSLQDVIDIVDKDAKANYQLCSVDEIKSAFSGAFANDRFQVVKYLVDNFPDVLRKTYLTEKFIIYCADPTYNAINRFLWGISGLNIHYNYDQAFMRAIDNGNYYMAYFLYNTEKDETKKHFMLLSISMKMRDKFHRWIEKYEEEQAIEDRLRLKKILLENKELSQVDANVFNIMADYAIGEDKTLVLPSLFRESSLGLAKQSRRGSRRKSRRKSRRGSRQ